MMQRKALPLILALLMAFSLQSCLMTKTSVGTFKEDVGSTYTYAKGKQLWLLWGLVPIGRADVDTPLSGNCQIVTKYTFGDFLISGITGGLIISYSIRVKAKRSSPGQ